MPEQSLLDARLAEIDRRLRAIQIGLRPAEEEPVGVPTAEPESVEAEHAESNGIESKPPAADPRAPAAARPDLVGELRALAESHERLLELHRELLSEYASLLERRIAEQPPPPAAS